MAINLTDKTLDRPKVCDVQGLWEYPRVVAVVNKNTANREIPYLGVYHSSTGTLFHWWGGPTRMHLHNDFVVMHDYGSASELTDELEDDIYIHFSLNFVPIRKTNLSFYWKLASEDRNGYLNPEGELLFCKDGGHTALAKSIYIQSHKKVEHHFSGQHYETAIFDEGYVRIASYFPTMPSDTQLTSKQVEALESMNEEARKFAHGVEKWAKLSEFLIKEKGK